jgi:hypothetical protein
MARPGTAWQRNARASKDASDDMRDDTKNKVTRRDLLEVYPKYKGRMGHSVEILDIHQELTGLSTCDNLRLGPFYDVVNTDGKVFGGVSHKHFSCKVRHRPCGAITANRTLPTSTAETPYVPIVGRSATQQGFGWSDSEPTT